MEVLTIPFNKIIFSLLCLFALSACTAKSQPTAPEDTTATSDFRSFQANLKKEADDKNKHNYQHNITYQQLVDEPNRYIKARIRFSGKIIAILKGSEYSLCHFQIDDDSTKIIILTIPDEQLAQQPLSKGDEITSYGVSEGHYTYESPSGAFITLPMLEVRVFEMNN
ncbi:hypothetical protein ACJYYY_05085 [Brochothrix campestris]|uniref:hypothetical protein n=1 Tax=Brochothrix campestris TaxID=2757 RepID=UPI0038D21272